MLVIVRTRRSWNNDGVLKSETGRQNNGKQKAECVWVLWGRSSAKWIVNGSKHSNIGDGPLEGERNSFDFSEMAVVQSSIHCHVPRAKDGGPLMNGTS